MDAYILESQPYLLNLLIHRMDEVMLRDKVRDLHNQEELGKQISLSSWSYTVVEDHYHALRYVMKICTAPHAREP